MKRNNRVLALLLAVSLMVPLPVTLNADEEGRGNTTIIVEHVDQVDAENVDNINSRDTIVNSDTVVFNVDGSRLINATSIININGLFKDIDESVDDAETIEVNGKKIYRSRHANMYWPEETVLTALKSTLLRNNDRYHYGSVYTGWFYMDPEEIAKDTERKSIDILSTSESGEFKDGNIPLSPEKAVLGNDAMVVEDYFIRNNNEIKSASDSSSYGEYHSFEAFSKRYNENKNLENRFTRKDAITLIYKALGTQRIRYEFFSLPYKDDTKKDYVPIGGTPFLELVPDTFAGIPKNRYYTMVFTSRTNPDEYYKDAKTEGVISDYEYSSPNSEISLSDFARLLWRKMVVENEPVMPESEMFLIITKMGKVIPFTKTVESREAIKNLLARGIVDEKMNFSIDTPDYQTILTLLHRAKSKDARVDFKKVEIPAEDLIKTGYYTDSTSASPVQGFEEYNLNDSTIDEIMKGGVVTDSMLEKAEIDEGVYSYFVDTAVLGEGENPSRYTYNVIGHPEINFGVRQEVRVPYIFAKIPIDGVSGDFTLVAKSLDNKKVKKIHMEAGGGLYTIDREDAEVITMRNPIPNEFAVQFTWNGDPRTSQAVSPQTLRNLERIQFASTDNKSRVVMFNILKSRLGRIKYDDIPLDILSMGREEMKKKYSEDKYKFPSGDIDSISVKETNITRYNSSKAEDKVVQVIIRLTKSNDTDRFMSRLQVSSEDIDSLPIYYNDQGVALVDSRWLIKNGFIEYIRVNKDETVFTIEGPRLSAEINISDPNRRTVISGQLVQVFSKLDTSPLITESFENEGQYLIDFRIISGSVGSYFIHRDSNGDALLMLKKEVTDGAVDIFTASSDMVMDIPFSADKDYSQTIPMFNNGFKTVGENWSFDITTPIMTANWFVIKDESAVGSDKLVIIQPRVFDGDGVIEEEKTNLSESGIEVNNLDEVLDKLSIKVYNLTSAVSIIDGTNDSIQTSANSNELYTGIRWSKQKDAYVYYPPEVNSSNLADAYDYYLSPQKKQINSMKESEVEFSNLKKHALPIFKYSISNQTYLVNLNVNMFKGARGRLRNGKYIPLALTEEELFKSSRLRQLSGTEYTASYNSSGTGQKYQNPGNIMSDSLAQYSDTSNIRLAVVSPQYALFSNAKSNITTIPKSEILSARFYYGSYKLNKKIKYSGSTDEISITTYDGKELANAEGLKWTKLMSTSLANVYGVNNLNSLIINEIKFERETGEKIDLAKKFENSQFKGMTEKLKKVNDSLTLKGLSYLLTVVHLVTLTILPRIIAVIFFAFMMLALVVDNKHLQVFAAKVVDPFKILSFGVTDISQVKVGRTWILIFFATSLLWMFADTLTQVAQKVLEFFFAIIR